jgi:hypothetical protein
MTDTYLPGHPFALITNNVVTHVLAMQTHDQTVIDETLSKFTYDSYVDCSKYDHPILIGMENYNNYFRWPSPYASWSWDDSIKEWTPPIPYPGKIGETYVWDEVTTSWILCTDCDTSN